jgi:hypothetical protein
MSKSGAFEMTSSRSRSSSSEVQALQLFIFLVAISSGHARFRETRRESIFQPTFGFNGGLERSARTRFRGCRFGSLSQSLVSQLPVRLLTVNCGQGEHIGRRRVSIGYTLTTEVSLDFIVPKGHSVKVARLPSFVEGLDAGRYAVLSLRISEKRLIRPIAMGVIPISVQPKSEPAAIVPATIQTPKAMIPTEIKNESTVSMIGSPLERTVEGTP